MLKTVLKYASAPNFSGAIVALGFLYGQFALQKTFHEGQQQIARSIEVHSSIIVGMQIQMLADGDGDHQILLSTLQGIQAQLRSRE